jgi:hypothetical protein
MLEQLVAPKMHTRRNEYKLLAEYLSFPAIGYAKLAWQKGLPGALEIFYGLFIRRMPACAERTVAGGGQRL